MAHTKLLILGYLRERGIRRAGGWAPTIREKRVGDERNVSMLRKCL